VDSIKANEAHKRCPHSCTYLLLQKVYQMLAELLKDQSWSTLGIVKDISHVRNQQGIVVGLLVRESIDAVVDGKELFVSGKEVLHSEWELQCQCIPLENGEDGSRDSARHSLVVVEAHDAEEAIEECWEVEHGDIGWKLLNGFECSLPVDAYFISKVQGA